MHMTDCIQIYTYLCSFHGAGKSYRKYIHGHGRTDLKSPQTKAEPGNGYEVRSKVVLKRGDCFSIVVGNGSKEV